MHDQTAHCAVWYIRWSARRNFVFNIFRGDSFRKNIIIKTLPFELWLLLHQTYPPRPLPSSVKLCENELKRMLGHYDKANYNTDKLVSAIELAIEHAQQLDSNHTDVWPKMIGTQVHRLVIKLISKYD
ncbi:RloB domain-containing protein [Candidatus Viridilinea mediisalina]|uniref:Uncharacterized protein n=1 Tax=Candidatus Viridilinea mediisalina TaxID=2024553 RepID=A0A2A6RK36_9CHLR|nr:hypothetical protein CJ255_09915 [Candidatus Viridilinea mediisalina]